MAGIGFDLLKLWKKNTYQSLVKAYALTTMMGSGPGLLIILSIGAVCFLTLFSTPTLNTAQQFLTIIIYLISGSMITSSLLQYTFFRAMADKVFSKDFVLITPNCIGVLFVQLVVSIIVSVPVIFYFFSGYSLVLKIMCLSCFILLSLIWVSTVLLTGLKEYRLMIWGFFLGYSTMIIIHFLVENDSLVFLIFQFLLSQAIILSILLYAILGFYPTDSIIHFDFLKKGNFFYCLMLSNFSYTIGLWIDKYIFWFSQETGFTIAHHLRLSPIYDLPMFIAYLTVIPAISVFMLHIEADFSLAYPQFMDAIFQRKTLAEIDAVRDKLVKSGKRAVLSLLKIQSAIIIITFLSVPTLFQTFKITPQYLPLLFILMIAAGLNVILWGLLNILYYMAQHFQAMIVSLILLTSNLILSLGSLYIGPPAYGYGLAISLLLAIFCALVFLNKDFKDLEYTTFMLVD